MSLKTIIAWTDHTFNIAWGCTKIDPGCAHCYAETLSTRYGHSVWGPNAERRTFGEKHWREPLEWNQLARSEGRRHKVFCSSMCDIFEDHPTITAERAKLWSLIQDTPWLDWQLLTKRADRIKSNLPSAWEICPFSNVWLGVSISEPKGVWRADCLRRIPAAVRFISYEPALGDLSTALNLWDIHWLIYGGESGPGYRPHNLDWPRAMRDKCAAAGVAFFYKQSSAYRTEMGTTLDGETIRQFPGHVVQALSFREGA